MAQIPKEIVISLSSEDLARLDDLEKKVENLELWVSNIAAQLVVLRHNLRRSKESVRRMMTQLPKYDSNYVNRHDE